MSGGRKPQLPREEVSTISWRFGKMDAEMPWPTTIADLAPHLDRLKHFEGQTPVECYGEKHNHLMRVGELCTKAQNRLKKLGIDVPLTQLWLKEKCRLWGIMEKSIFHVLWLDENHEVYPVKLKGHR
ncbi:MAG: hypothetical protein LBR22_10065 [Desulfovibrio sp.]|jgi:hypothetical protein|nr:hypothetical protein [Desulfovibrio sp.]